MLDHIGISIPPSRLEEITNWYLAALAPLGYTKHKDFPGVAVGLGPEKYSIPFWIGANADAPASKNHIAFRCADRATVDKFHEEALKAGGKCNGKPGVRHMYHAKYYAAFVLDPVGNNIEVVDHGAP
ncbi:glyoxalase family protein [Phaeosphaeriaceae sp. PMI808]|nr:glyoxalase family protein [Phaeosphaeriaceae sp. PMI808]